MTKSDPQQDRVYAMEKSVLSGHNAGRSTLRELRKHARLMAEHFNVPLPPIKICRLPGEEGYRTLASYHYHIDGGEIRLSPSACNLCSLAHEFAHHITWHLHVRYQEHGPTWLGYYIKLLDMLRLVPQAGMVAVCRNRRLKYKLR